MTLVGANANGVVSTGMTGMVAHAGNVVSANNMIGLDADAWAVTRYEMNSITGMDAHAVDVVRHEMNNMTGMDANVVDVARHEMNSMTGEVVESDIFTRQ